MNLNTLMFLSNVTNVTNQTLATNPFQVAVDPIVKLINMAVGPLLMIVGAVGTLYCVFLGIKLAKAEEPQEREKAKGALKNAIIGFVLIFVLIAALNLMMDPLVAWMKGTGVDTVVVP